MSFCLFFCLHLIKGYLYQLSLIEVSNFLRQKKDSKEEISLHTQHSLPYLPLNVWREIFRILTKKIKFSIWEESKMLIQTWHITQNIAPLGVSSPTKQRSWNYQCHRHRSSSSPSLASMMKSWPPVVFAFAEEKLVDAVVASSAQRVKALKKNVFKKRSLENNDISFPNLWRQSQNIVFCFLCSTLKINSTWTLVWCRSWKLLEKANLQDWKLQFKELKFTILKIKWSDWSSPVNLHVCSCMSRI